MRLARLFLVSFLILFSIPADAQERVTLGVGHLFTNDYLGDGQDRWRSGAYTLSWMRATEGTVSLPQTPGALMEYRFANRIIAPANLVTPAPGDRRYAGVVSLGAFTHFARSGNEFSLGAELVAVGPSTGVASFQDFMHGLFGTPGPSAATIAAQIPDALYPTLALEAARPMALGGGVVLRPFAQLRAGDETYLRAGADLLFGSNFTSGVLVRDETTGILYQTLDDQPAEGFSFLLGADTARVFNSAYLPTPAYTLTPWRNRLRAGLHWQGEKLGLFYGATWSGPEFAAQAGGQVLGSVQIQMRF